jgi:hypothetical protein
MPEHPTRRLDNQGNPTPPDRPTQRLVPHDADTAERPCLRCGFPLIPVIVEESTRGELALGLRSDKPHQPPRVLSFGPLFTYTIIPCQAMLCTECGYTELVANAPFRLKE